jgi:hypothetical protein
LCLCWWIQRVPLWITMPPSVLPKNGLRHRFFFSWNACHKIEKNHMPVESDVSNLCVVLLFVVLGIWILSIFARVKVALDAYSCAKKNCDGGGRMYLATMAKLRNQTLREIMEERDAMQRQGSHLLVPTMTLPCKLQSTSETNAALRQRRAAAQDPNRAQHAPRERPQEQQQQQQSHHSREASMFSLTSSASEGAAAPAAVDNNIPQQRGVGNSNGCTAASAPGVHRIVRLVGSMLTPISALLGRNSTSSSNGLHGVVASDVQPPSRLRRIDSAATHFGGAETTTGGSQVGEDEDDADSVTTHYVAAPVSWTKERERPTSSSTAAAAVSQHHPAGKGFSSAAPPPSLAAALLGSPIAASPAYSAQPQITPSNPATSTSTVVISVFVEHDAVSRGAAIQFFQQPGSPSGGTVALRSVSVRREESFSRRVNQIGSGSSTASPEVGKKTAATGPPSITTRMSHERATEDAPMVSGVPARYSLPAALTGAALGHEEQRHKLQSSGSGGGGNHKSPASNKKQMRPPPLDPPFMVRPSLGSGGSEPASVLIGTGGSSVTGARAAVRSLSPQSKPFLRVHVLLTSRKLLEEELLYNATVFRRDQASLFLTGHGAPHAAPSMAARGLSSTSRRSAAHQGAQRSAGSPPSSPLRICRRDGVVRGGRCRCRLRGFQLEQQQPSHQNAATPTAAEREDAEGRAFATTPISPQDSTTVCFSATCGPASSSHQRQRHAPDPQHRLRLATCEESSGDFGPCSSGGVDSGAFETAHIIETDSPATTLEALRVALTDDEWAEVSNHASTAAAAGVDDVDCVRAYLIMEKGTPQCGASQGMTLPPSRTSRRLIEDGGAQDLDPATMRSSSAGMTMGATAAFLDEPADAADSTMQFHRGGQQSSARYRAATDNNRSSNSITNMSTSDPPPLPKDTPLAPPHSGPAAAPMVNDPQQEQHTFSGTFSSSAFSPIFIGGEGGGGGPPFSSTHSNGGGGRNNNSSSTGASCSFVAELQFRRVATSSPTIIVVNAKSIGGGAGRAGGDTSEPSSAASQQPAASTIQPSHTDALKSRESSAHYSQKSNRSGGGGGVSFVAAVSSTTATLIPGTDGKPFDATEPMVENATPDVLEPNNNLDATTTPVKNLSGSLPLRDALAATVEGTDLLHLAAAMQQHQLFLHAQMLDTSIDADAAGCATVSPGGDADAAAVAVVVFPSEKEAIMGDVSDKVVAARPGPDVPLHFASSIRTPTQCIRSLLFHPPSPPPPIDDELFDAVVASAPSEAPPQMAPQPLPAELRLDSLVIPVDEDSFVGREASRGIGDPTTRSAPLTANGDRNLLAPSSASAASSPAAAAGLSSMTIQTLHTADVEPSFSYCRVGHRVYRVEPIFAVHEEEDDDDGRSAELHHNNTTGGSWLMAARRQGDDVHGATAGDVEMTLQQPPQHQPLCMICFHRPSTVILLPCHHFGFCVCCVRRLRHCPVCRQQIDHTLFLLEDVV